MSKNTFWETVDAPYQMGPQKHRLYMLDRLKEKDVISILDIGCGTGPLWELIKNLGYPFFYKGTDYSHHFIECAKQLFPDTHFEEQDMRELKEKDGSWDCVVLLHSLDHVKEYDKVIAEAARVAKRYVCIMLWRAFAPEVHINDRNMICKEPGDDPWEDTYLMQYSREALENEFKKNGLVIDEVAEGEVLNSDHSKYNFMYILRKENK